MTTQCTQAPLGFHPLCCLKMAMVCILSIFAKSIKTKDHSPSMTLSKCCLKTNDLSPLNLLRYLVPLLSWSYDDPHPSRLTSNDGASYQINGKVATSNGGGKSHLKPFEQVDYFQLLAQFQNKHPCYFQKQSHTLSKTSSKHFPNIEIFSKAQHFVYVLTNENY